MTERAAALMNSIWEARNSGVDTEEKLVAAILHLASENIQFFTTEDGRIVLDKNDMIQLAEELNA